MGKPQPLLTIDCVGLEKIAIVINANRGTKLPGIQVLRGIAASLVVFAHYAGCFEAFSPRYSWIVSRRLGDLGNSGVDIFFVISGFIMVYTTSGKAGPSDAWVFIQRRALRIYPLYWFWTTVLLSFWATGFALKTYHYSTLYMINSYLLIPYFNGSSFDPVLVQGWTLSFEMLFYLVFSCALFFKFVRWKLPFLLVSFTALFFLGGILSPDGGMRYLLTQPIIIDFLYGALVAEIVLRLPAPRNSFYQQMLPISLMCLGGIGFLYTVMIHAAISMRSIYYGIPALLIVLGAAMLRSTPCPRPLVFLGDASYSIYLTHNFSLMIFYWVFMHLHLFNWVLPDAVIVPATIITIIVCSFTYLLVERPMTRYLLFKTKLSSSL